MINPKLIYLSYIRKNEITIFVQTNPPPFLLLLRNFALTASYNVNLLEVAMLKIKKFI